MNIYGSLLVLVLSQPAIASSDAAEPIRIDEVFITLLDEVEVPAREAGILSEIKSREGKSVDKGDLLAVIDDTRAQFQFQKARAELEKALKEAGNDLKVQLAEKNNEVAVAELKRAKDAYARFAKSVSETELDRLRLSAERSALDIRQAKFELATAQIVADVFKADLGLAEHALDRRRIISPISGTVVEVKRREGEWVEPGEPVVRVVRMDRLRAEGFVDAKRVGPSLMDRPVQLDVEFNEGRGESFEGQIVFISPEVHPVNGKVLIWAEVQNRNALLRPGLRASMCIAASEP